MAKQNPALADQYQANAKALINGDPVHLDWQPIRRRRKFLGLF